MLLEAYRAGVRRVIATTKKQTVIHVAVQMALEVKIPVDEILGMLVDRMDSDDGECTSTFQCASSICWKLASTITRSRIARTFRTKKKWPPLKAGWKRFLQNHGQAIRNGKHFHSNSPEIEEMLYP